jgi:hypothetical protein
MGMSNKTIPPTDDGTEPERERAEERREGITRQRRGSPAAPSDRPENKPPHPQDVNEIGDQT